MNNNQEMICNYCFDSEVITKLIVENGVQGSSDYSCEGCSHHNEDLEDDIFCISKSDLVEQLAKSIRNLYVHINEYQLAGGGNESYVSLEEICSEFCDLCGYKVATMISNELWYEHKDGRHDSFGDINDLEWLPLYMVQEDNFDWTDFSKKVKHSLRFFDTKDFNRKEELQKLDSFLKKCCVDNVERVVFRSRGIAKKDKESINDKPNEKLGKAPSHLAKHNRFSPSGISYIYCASDENTAIYEAFDESKEVYAVAQFELKEQLSLLDFRKNNVKENIRKYINPYSDKFESAIFCASKVLEEFIQDIQKPISHNDKALEYLPTQVLAEYIRSLDYEGFIFDSSKKEDGYNIVLFEEQWRYKEHKFKIVSQSSFILDISSYRD
ncbi:MAG: RES family NAD+ phosphorylase [Campylobacterota bacterium]|nr:RES family NAD+ phosphorylase [Campylobacterota bacterium]